MDNPNRKAKTKLNKLYREVLFSLVDFERDTKKILNKADRDELRQKIKEYYNKLKKVKGEPQNPYGRYLDKLKAEALLERQKPPVDTGYYENPKGIADLTKNIFSNTGFREADFKGYTDKDKAEWEKDNLTASIATKDLDLLDQKKKKNPDQNYLIPTPPKITVSQLKSIDTLIMMLRKRNIQRGYIKQEQTADLEFSLKEYANERGKSEVARGGKFINELKRDLISGGITSYIIDLEKTTGKKSIFVNNFYGIEIPKPKSKEKWRVIFNPPYRGLLLQGGQFYPIIPEAIRDKNTDDRKGYIYFFLKTVSSYINTKTNFKTQPKVSMLLDEIKIGEWAKSKPKESYKILAECIYYIATNYAEYKIIREVKFFDSGKCKKTKVITDLNKFNEWDYKDFISEVLTPLGLTDVREACISFNTPIQGEIKTPETARQTGKDVVTL